MRRCRTRVAKWLYVLSIDACHIGAFNAKFVRAVCVRRGVGPSKRAPVTLWLPQGDVGDLVPWGGGVSEWGDLEVLEDGNVLEPEGGWPEDAPSGVGDRGQATRPRV